jgi:hypothetical protein
MVWATRGMKGAILAMALLTVAAKPASPVPTPTSEVYGDWSVTLFDGGISMATTSNNAGSVFGVFCTRTSACTAFFNPKIPCEDGSKYPALFNAPSAAYPEVMQCEKVGDSFLLEVALEGAVADAMSVGGQLGIAFPMKSGQFEVSRFSLTGAARAAARAQQMINEAPPSNQQGASDNFSL